MISQFVIGAFNNGLDLRRSADTAPPGSLRVLRNCFVNEGGELEKRKGFKRSDVLTTYGQTANYKGKITGPHIVPLEEGTVYFRHHHNSLPSTGWTAGAGSIAMQADLGHNGKAWAMKSTNAPTALGAMLCAFSHSLFGAYGHVFEAWLPTTSRTIFSKQHVKITFSGTSEPTAESVISANANREMMMVLRSKGYVVNGQTLFASAISDPGDMAGTGFGAVDVSTQGVPIGVLLGLGEYFSQLAVFGTRGVQFWTVDPDFSKNQYLRAMALTCIARRSILGYGSGDLLYLSNSGVRSLQANDSSNLARVSDVGSPIDKLLRAELSAIDAETELVNSSSPEQAITDFVRVAAGVVHPDSGQAWMCLKEQVFVLSNYPSAKVLAWSTFDLPQPAQANINSTTGALKSRWVADICPIKNTLIFRNFADEVFIYGDVDGAYYDTSQMEVITPVMDMGRPGTEKMLEGIDMACFGDWRVEIAVNPDDMEDLTNNYWAHVADISNSTHHLSRIPINLTGTHFALRLTSSSDFAARIGQITILYDGGEEK